MTSLRCNRTGAWVVPRGHFESRGRGVDLREAFFHDARRFAALSTAGLPARLRSGREGGAP